MHIRVMNIELAYINPLDHTYRLDSIHSGIIIGITMA